MLICNQVMIANISPAAVNVEESISTLRFAQRAKKVENVAVVKRDPRVEKLAELIKENAALRAQLAARDQYLAKLEEFY